MTLESDRAHFIERLEDMAARCEMDGKHEDAKALRWAMRELLGVVIVDDPLPFCLAPECRKFASDQGLYCEHHQKHGEVEP